MENVVTYRVKILTRNAFFVFRGKKLRGPVECHHVYEHELPVIKMQILKDSLQYEIIKESDIKESPVEPLIIEKRDKDVKVEELYDPEIEPNSIMDKLLLDEKKANEE